MSDQEILEKAIQKALDGGWRPRGFALEDGTDLYGAEEISTFDIYRYGLKKVTFFNQEAVRFFIPVWEIIFNHNFAKALWGESEDYPLPGINENIRLAGMPKYVWHLQQMVIADEPIKYLGENL